MNLYIPRHPSKITLKQFVSFHAAKTDAEKVKVITGLTDKQIGALKLETVDYILTTFETGATGAGELQRLVKIRTGLIAKRLGFIPDLEDMSLSEYVDIDNYRSSLATKVRINYTNLPLLMSVLYRPTTIRWPFGKYYRIKPYDASEVRYYMEYIEALPMSVVNAALAFFLPLQNRLLENSHDYLVTELKKTVENLQTL